MKKIFSVLIFTALLFAAVLLTGCGEEPTSEHVYIPNVIAPTCEEAGYTEYTCTHCNDSYVGEIAPALGHSEETIDPIDPGCDAPGYTSGIKCSRCEMIMVKPDLVPQVGHHYTVTVIAPTCVEKGYNESLCIKCGHTYKDSYVDATGHSWADDAAGGFRVCTVCQTREELGGEDGGDTNLPLLTVTYVDVGQGDCIFIKLGDCDILIDAGKPEYGMTVSKYLSGIGVDDIELMINTHLDNDHYGGLPQVLKDFVVEAFWGTGYQKSGSGITSLKSDVAKEGLEYVTPAVGTVFTYQNLKLTVIYNGAGASNSNDSSIVVMLEYGEHKFLFTGDIGQKAEGKLVSEGADLACDVLKVGHHGSKTSSTAAFLAATGAKYGVICVGTGNSYGHPTSTALNNLASAGITVYRTDLSGHVVFSSDGVDLSAPASTGRSVDYDPTAAAPAAIVYDVEQINELLKRRYFPIAA